VQVAASVQAAHPAAQEVQAVSALGVQATV
jgi:hypothetical protein